ncbi:MAG: (deoxy)nucleoside triphosphate pyrophosphohydrolase [Alphaproteobacteria bacterium]
MNRLVLAVACALIDSENRVLLAQRPPGKPMAGLWEFPGGKCEPGETPEAALIRELHEELGIAAEPRNLIPLCFASHSYGPESGDFHLLMPLYACRQWRGECRPREAQNLIWAAASHLCDYPMPAADEPLIGPLQHFLKIQ